MVVPVLRPRGNIRRRRGKESGLRRLLRRNERPVTNWMQESTSMMEPRNRRVRFVEMMARKMKPNW